VTGRRAIVIEFLLVLAGCLIVISGFAAAGMHPRPAWFVAAAVCAAIVVGGIRVVARTVARTDWLELQPVTWGRAFNSDSRVRMVGSQLRQSSKDPYAFRTRIQPMLATMVTSRLKRRHGVDPAYDPVTARALTGDWLWDLVTTTEARTPSPDEIARAVEAVERL
jgi:hypothetical protein